VPGTVILPTLPLMVSPPSLSMNAFSVVLLNQEASLAPAVVYAELVENLCATAVPESPLKLL
jgi:hypothetical protein